MAVDIENALYPLVKMSRGPSWDQISRIIANDDKKDLREQLEQASVELVMRPQDAQRNSTALHVAIQEAATDCLQILLTAIPHENMLNSPDCDGNTPLHAAIRALNYIFVEKLLTAGVNPNARNNKGFSALHLLSYSANTATSSDKIAQVKRCTDLLLCHSGIDIEAIDYSKATPLQAAAGNLSSKVSSVDDLCRKLINAGALVDASTLTLLNKHIIPNITVPLRVEAKERPGLAPMFDYLILDQPERISQLFMGEKVQAIREASNWYIGSKKVLYYLVDRCNEAGVQTLLKAGADPWTISLEGELALHRALARGHFPIVNVLIEEMKTGDTNMKVDLRFSSFSLIQNALENHKAKPCDSIKCLRRLFEADVWIDANQKKKGSMNQTALHIAGAMNNQEAMAVLLQHGAYLGERRIIDSQDSGTVIKTLLTKTLITTMNNCIHLPSNTNERTEDDLLDPDYTLEMDYKFLINPQTTETSNVPRVHNEVAVMFDLSQSKEHRYAIKHPLLQTLLYAKWRKIFPLSILNLVLYLTFVIFLTAFMHTLKNHRILEMMVQTGNSTDPMGLLQRVERHQTTRNALMGFIIFIAFYMVVKEVFQIIFTYKSYFRSIKNYLEWFLIIAVITVSIVPLSVDSTKHLAAWAIIAAWYDFVLVLGRAPPLAIYITMLRHVSWNFSKLVAIFGFLIIAFSISFNIILQPSTDPVDGGDFTDFAGFWKTLPRAIVMATGEFNYSSIREGLSTSTIFATSTVLIFLVFLFMIFLVLMNVMTGLAVTDAKEIMEDAILHSLKSRLELVYLIEQFLIKVRFLHKLLPFVQLLSNKQRRLLVKINTLPECNRIVFSDDGEEERMCNLDNKTADVIRNLRLHQLAEARAQKEENPTDQILQILQEIQKVLSMKWNPQKDGDQ